jgi:hypothetical protein
MKSKTKGCDTCEYTGWISVQDELPPNACYYDCKKYLIFCGYTEIAYWYNEKWIDDPDGFYRTFDPTHWMTFPLPPVSR